LNRNLGLQANTVPALVTSAAERRASLAVGDVT
jgi:hypothetical protein